MTILCNTCAKSLAINISYDIKTHGENYDRGELRVFQRAAGIQVDGLYGPDSKAALEKFVAFAPPPLFGGAVGAMRGASPYGRCVP